ncbi:MAG: mshA 2 [Gammaproteobacteria bacterium]|nr:mshA 2 [Gammaproteobacteria bacterium]
MRPISILYIHNSAHIAGGNRALLGLFDHLNPDRFRAVSVLPTRGPMESELRMRGVPHLILPVEAALTRSSVQGLRLVSQLGRVLVSQRIRFVHANDSRCYRHASVAARMLGVGRICHLQFPPDHRGLAWAFKVRPDVVITCSAHMRGQLKSAGLTCLRSVPIVPVENAVDTHRFRPPENLDQLRRSLGLEGNSQVVTIVGSVSERKGHRDFLDVAKQVLGRLPLALFLVVGDDIEGKGAYRVAMEDYARTLGIASRVRFVGFRADTVDWVAASDVIVLPSLQEGLPLSLAEAHGCAKPVVATRIDGIPEIVDDGVTGFLFEPHDVAGMSTAVTRLLEDASLRLQMGTAGRRRAEEIFSQRTHAAKVQEVYERVLNGSVASLD